MQNRIIYFIDLIIPEHKDNTLPTVRLKRDIPMTRLELNRSFSNTYIAVYHGHNLTCLKFSMNYWGSGGSLQCDIELTGKIDDIINYCKDRIIKDGFEVISTHDEATELWGIGK